MKQIHGMTVKRHHAFGAFLLELSVSGSIRSNLSNPPAFAGQTAVTFARAGAAANT